MENIDDLLAKTLKAWAPPPKLSLSEWADEYAYLSAESSAEAGKWHTLPYQKGIMDAFTDQTVEQITVMKSARVGYTKILNNIIGYHIHYDPCPIMLVQPTIEDAEGYSKEEIAPMLRDTPVLRNLVADARSRDSNNTIVQKNFPGGTLSLVGANSPRGFRRVSRRVVLFDEVDGYPPSAGAEGDQIKLGIKRSEYYWNRKIAAGSTPTVTEQSRIEKMFRESDQRRYFVPCPHCGELQFLKWGGKDEPYGIKWPEGDPMAAYYVCEHNGCIIDHGHKKQMIENGEWLATAEGNGKHAGFHIWAAYSYSPNATWGHLAVEFLDAKDDPLKLKTFVNTALGETWEEEYSSRLDAEGIGERAENYQLLTVPKGALLLTAGIDVQDNRIAVVVKGYGVDEESWLVNWTEIHGDPSDLTSSGPWAQVDNVLQQEYVHESGATIKVRAAAVDTGGHFTNEAYVFCRERKKRHVIAIKGSSMPGRAPLGKPSRQDVNYKNQTLKKGVELWLIGVDAIKTTIYSRLKKTGSGAGAMHFPLGIPNEYYEQLTAEKQSTRYVNGFPKRTWVKKSGARNEALDCEVYAYAALQYFYTRVNRATLWLQLEKLLGKVDDIERPATDEPVESPTSPVRRRNSVAPPRRRGGFVKGWK